MKNSSFVMLLSCFLAMALAPLTVSAASNAKITYHGRLLKPDSTPVIASNVQFRIQIFSPGAGNCLMYDETHVRDLSASDGAFAISLNADSPQTPNSEPFDLDRVFQNRGTFNFAVGKCSGGGTTYIPAADDGRKLVLQFNDGGGWETVPTQSVNQVPQAVDSMTVGGWKIGQLFRVTDGSGDPVALSAWSQTDYTKLLSIISSGNVTGSSASFTGSLAGDVSGTQSATSVDKIKGRELAATAPTDGQVLKWNGTSSKWEPANDVGASGTVLSVSAGTGGVTVTGTASAPVVNVGAATTSALGVVQLANGAADTTAGHVVQANDTRLSDARAPSGTAGGDLSLTYPNPKVSKIQGVAVSATTPNAGEVMKLVGTDWTPAPIRLSDIKSTVSGDVFPAAACSTSQVLQYSVANNNFTCQSITYSETNPGILDFAKNTPSADFTTPANVLTLATVGVAKGGTGLTAMGTANQILGVNNGATAMEYKSLVQGSGITITHGAGTVTIAASGGSESTTASNIGTAGVGVFKTMSGSDLQFKKLNAASNGFTVTDDTGNNKIDLALNSELAALSQISSTGFIKRTAANTYSASSVNLASDVGATILPVANGGTGVSSIGNFMVMGTTSGGAVTGIAGSVNGSILQYSATGPVYSTAAYPSTISANQILYGSASNVVGGLSTSASSFMTTTSGSVPQFTALSADTFTQYALLAGRSGGQTILGGTANSENLVLNSTSGGTKGYVLLASNGGNVGVGTTTPNANTVLDVNGVARVLSSVEGAATLANTGAAITVADLSKNVRRYTLDANTTITLPVITSLPADAAYSLTIRVKQDATGSRTLAFAGNGNTIKWDSGSMTAAASAANTETIYQFMIVGGESVWYASAVWKEN